MFNCGATLQQSSDLFYQKFLKIESKILPLPASAAAARKRKKKNLCYDFSSKYTRKQNFPKMWISNRSKISGSI